MKSEDAFLSSLGSWDLFGPKSTSPITGQPAVRWNHVKLLQPAVAFWRVARGCRAIFDAEWPSRMGAFSCALGSHEKPPLLLSEMLTVRDRGAASLGHPLPAENEGVPPAASVWRMPLHFAPPRRWPWPFPVSAVRPRLPSCPQMTSVLMRKEGSWI